MTLSGQRRSVTTAIVAAMLVLTAACNDSSDGDSSKSGDGDAKSLKGANLAVFIPTKANTYFAASIEGIQKEAERLGADVEVFDAGFDPNKQYSQIQDAITTGRYDAMLIASLDGTSIASLVPEAQEAGITVVGLNQPMSPDFTTVDSKVDGLAGEVLRPASEHGTAIGKMTVEACQDIDPCKVAYLYIQKGSPPDSPVNEYFNKAIESSANVEVVAEGDSMATREGGLSAAQDILTAHPDINVFVGTDQAVLGAQDAAAAEDLSDVTFIGIGGSAQAIAAIEQGTFFGTSATVPTTEGRLAIEALQKAISTGMPVGGQDPVIASGVPNDGLITKEYVSEFTPEFDG